MSRLTRRVRTDVSPMILKMLNLEETPEECIEVVGTDSKTCDEVCEENQCSTCVLSAVFEKLAHYEDLEEQGELVLFPSYAYFIKDKKVYEGWVQEVMYWHSRKPLYDIRYDDNSLANYRGYLSLTVFLTKEEAEAKLRELNTHDREKGVSELAELGGKA